MSEVEGVEEVEGEAPVVAEAVEEVEVAVAEAVAFQVGILLLQTRTSHPDTS